MATTDDDDDIVVGAVVDDTGPEASADARDNNRYPAEDSTGDDTRPDGRQSTPATLKLRAATRALRLHLDSLPVDYDEQVAPDRFLAGLAFMLARNRYSCAESLIGASFGGALIGALARSVLVDGLRWLWIAQDDSRRVCLLGDLLEERSGIAAVAHLDPLTRVRMLMPVPAVADLTGSSRAGLDAPSMPTDDELLDELFATPVATTQPAVSRLAATDGTGALQPNKFLQQAHEMLDLAGLRGAAMVLAHAGHGNYLGQRSTLTEDGTPGFDLRSDHEALFMHVAAVGAFAVLVGSDAAAPDAWPHDVDRHAFLTTAAALAENVADAATAIHGLAAKTKPGSRTPKQPASRRPSLLRGAVLIENDDVVGELVDIDYRLRALTEAFENFIALVHRTAPVTTPPQDGIALHSHLTYGAALSNVQAVHSTYDQPGGQVIALFAARSLLEEAARLAWRYSVPGEEARARAKQYFDEFRHRQRQTIRILAGQGMKKDALRLFTLPANVLVPPGVDTITKNRTPIPSIAAMLRAFGAGSADPDWLEAAYKLLSQVTHATPLGYLHCLRYLDAAWVPNDLSVEMFALSLDVSAFGGGYLIGTMTVLFNDVSPVAQQHYRELRAAATAVHLAAREIHGLDLPTASARFGSAQSR